MRTTTVNENLIQLTRLGLVNAYLVREPDGFTLVDTTMGRSADALLESAHEAGGEIRRILLTHGHADHVGLLDALKRQLGDSAEVLMSELDARIHAGEKVVEGKLPGSWPALTTEPDVRLTGGERVGSLEVIASPGHSPGHLALRDTRDRTLIAGDVFTTYGRVAVTNRFNLRFPFAAMATWDQAMDLESAKALRRLDPDLLAVGHGPVVREPGAAMDDAIARSSA